VRIIKTKKHEIVNGRTLLVAVDLGKSNHMGYYRCPDGTDIKPFEFLNNRLGHQKFYDRICQAKAAYHLEEVVVGFESTGVYGEPLIHFLNNKGIKLVQVNPLHTKRMKELEGNSPGKTDRKDPKVIADIMELGHFLTVVIPEGVSAELRRLTQARERSVERRTAFYNQLQDLVFIIFPEFLEVMKDIKTRSAQYLLRHYPTPQAILQCGVDGLSLALKRVSCGKLGRERAEALYEATSRSAGIEEGQKSILLEIEEILLGIERGECFIAKLEREMRRLLEQIPYSRLILSVKGIKAVTAAGLIGEVGDFRKFRTISELLKLAGLDLYEISSGNHTGNRHITKRGRSLLRKLLFFASLNMIRKGGVMHEPYQRYIGRGMPTHKALVAISRKLLRILFALVRDHREYVVNYSERENLKLAA
jgi:transposase